MYCKPMVKRQGIAGDTYPLAQGIRALILNMSFQIYIVFKRTFTYLSIMFSTLPGSLLVSRIADLTPDFKVCLS